MAKSSAEYYEVRWRVSGSNEAWSAPQRVAPAHEIVVENLDRTKTYEFEVRAVSACGAKSDWVSGTHTVPDVLPGNLTLADIKTEADNAAADALAANAELANIASDNILSQGEKPVVIRDTNVITTEQPGIDAQATAFGVTTEKAAYDNAVTALTTYLATLTTPVLWSDLTDDTTIVGTTFRSKFADVYTNRQALLNAIYAAAKAKADAAQADATKGLGLATQLPVINGGFTTLPAGYGWSADAGTGWVTDTSGGTPGVGPNGAMRVAGVGSTTGAYRNEGLMAVQAGQVVKAQALFKLVGVTGSAFVYISWLDSSVSEFATSIGNQLTGTVTDGSYVVGIAPAGTVYAKVCLGYSGMTAGTVYADNVVCTQYPSNVDEVPDGLIYGRAIDGFHSETVDNANFELAADSAGNVPGWISFHTATLSVDTALHYEGAQSLKIAGPVGFTSWGAESKRKYACTPGDVVSMAAALYSTSGVKGSIQIRFYNSAGTAIGSAQTQQASFSAWEVVSAYGTAPAGTAYFTLLGYSTSTSGGQINMDRVRVSVNDVRVAGSGATLGNQFNAPNSLTLNYGAVRSTTALSATSAGAVSVAAFNYYAGAASVHYNAVSNAVTGLTQSVTYFIYCRDAGPVGGTKTWLATTNVNALLQTYDDIVVAGQVTIPTSGSSGGGGGGLCVCDDMVVAEGRRAGDARRGDVFDCLDLPTSGMTRFQRALEAVDRSVTECVRLTTEGGAVLECSTSTPFDLPGGGVEWAPRMAGHEVVTDRGVERVALVEHLGARPVSHIHLGGCSYAAGRDAGHRIYSHNLQWKP